MKILLVEDDELIAQGLAKALTDQHYTVDVAADGKAGWELVESFTYDLILLDLVLPKLDGMSFCRRLRSQGNQTPVLLLTAQDTSTNKVIGLDAGADDYVAKPFNLPELLARIRALLRRGGAALPPLLEWRNLQLDPSTCEVTCNNQPLRLTPKEYGLIELFLRTPHRIFSSGALIEQLWSFEEPPTEDTVRSHLKGLRQKLKAAGIVDNPIETVYGIGYRLKAVDKDSDSLDNQKNNRKSQNPKSSSAAARSAIQNQTEIGVQNIWQQVKETMNQRVSAIAQATTMVLQDRLSEELRGEAQREAHKLAGSLGMFGSDKGSLLAKEIESLFESGVRLENHQAQHLSELVAALRQELQRMDKQQIPEPQPVPEAPQTNASKVMVVDDDPLVLTALQNLLKPWGFHPQRPTTVL
jgi:DNA-binding response OmpR family regulator/HPt (histidine-containing phosphotransfer) domain-containing protein